MVVALFGCALALVFLTHRGVVADERDPLPTCESGSLSTDVASLVRQVLTEGQSLDSRPYSPALQRLLADETPTGVEARVALLAYYLGEHAGEELLESTLAHGETATTLVRKYMTCRPAISGEWRIGTLRVSRTKYRIYLDEIARSGSRQAPETG
jgi:hypothetical protein